MPVSPLDLAFPNRMVPIDCSTRSIPHIQRILFEALGEQKENANELRLTWVEWWKELQSCLVPLRHEPKSTKKNGFGFKSRYKPQFGVCQFGSTTFFSTRLFFLSLVWWKESNLVKEDYLSHSFFLSLFLSHHFALKYREILQKETCFKASEHFLDWFTIPSLISSSQNISVSFKARFSQALGNPSWPRILRTTYQNLANKPKKNMF